MKFAIICAAVVAFALLVTGCMTGCGAGYSDGTRTGTITKFSRRGLVFKSYEGEMNLGGMKAATDSKGTATMVPNVWAFHASGDMVAKIEAAQQTGAPVSITYRQWAISPITQDAGYDVVSIAETK